MRGSGKNRKRLTWRKYQERWQLGKFKLSWGGEDVGVVAPQQESGRWYWYGNAPGKKGHNSLWEGMTYATADEAKAACKTYVQRQLGQPTEKAQ